MVTDPTFRMRYDKSLKEYKILKEADTEEYQYIYMYVTISYVYMYVTISYVYMYVTISFVCMYVKEALTLKPA